MSIAAMPVSQAPDQVLQQALQGMVSEIKPYEALAELNSRVKAKQAAQAMQGNNAIMQAQQMQQQPPVAAQVVQANNMLSRGIGGLPVPESQSFSGGGIVAFADGGIAPASRESLGGGSYLFQLARNFGINLSPYDDPDEREVKIERLRRLKAIDEWALTNSARIPNEFAVEPPGVTAPTVAMPTAPEIPIPEIDVAEVKVPRTPSVSASTGARTAVAPAAAPAPKGFKYEAPKVPVPEGMTVEELEAQIAGRVNPRLSEYDKRMQRFRDRAEAMERGEGIKDPSRLDRGISGFLSGGAEEVAAARRAGVRPSLGMALAGAARSAKAEDKEREKARRDLQEKGMQLNMLLEQRREAYENGQYERYNTLTAEVRKREDAIRAAQAAQAKADYEATKDTRTDEVNQQELAQRAQLTREQMANAVKIANIGAAARVAGAGGASGLSAEERAKLNAMKASPAWKMLNTQATEIAKKVSSFMPGTSIHTMETQKARQLMQQMAAMYQSFGIAPQNDPDFVSLQNLFGDATAPTATNVPPELRALVEKWSGR